MITELKEIYTASCIPLYSVNEGIPINQFNWKPAPDSRSINEIMCHLIRVDNSFLKKLGRNPAAYDPKNGSPADVTEQLKVVHAQMEEMITGCRSDSELFEVSIVPGAGENDTIYGHVIHSAQHNLYHLAQLIYLRRALDRNWNSPIDEWDKATRIIAKLISQS